VSIFRNTRTDKGSTRRVRLRHLLPLALLALMAVLLVPAGGAKPPPTMSFDLCVQNATLGTPAPACSATGSASSFAGNTVATIKLTVTNDRSSTVSLGSADVNVPPQLKVISDSASPASNVSTSDQTIKIRNISLNKGQSFVATFNVGVACAGSGDWTASQSAFNSTDGSGTSFGLVTGNSTGLSSGITTACHLAFVDQPTDTVSGQPISRAGASQGGAVTVGLFDNGGNALTSCPAGYSTCSVDIGPVGVVSGTTTEPLSGADFLASFADLSITNAALATQYNLTASGDGSFAPPVTSASFLIAQAVNRVTCAGGNCSQSQQSLSGQDLNGNDLTPSIVDVNGVTNFNFMTLSPYTLGTVPDGCTGRKDLGVAGFAESDGRSGAISTLTINFYVNMDNIKARYGANTGQQFIPICVGARPVDSNGTAHDCGDPNFASVGWTGDGINSTTGKFTGKPATARCNADGYYWGIIGSFQDKIPAGNPVVTSWGGTSVNGTNYRVFTMSVPSGWDYRGGP
jgi:hypothetical protein